MPLTVMSSKSSKSTIKKLNEIKRKYNKTPWGVFSNIRNGEKKAVKNNQNKLKILLPKYIILKNGSQGKLHQKIMKLINYEDVKYIYGTDQPMIKTMTFNRININKLNENIQMLRNIQWPKCIVRPTVTDKDGNKHKYIEEVQFLYVEFKDDIGEYQIIL